LEQVAEARHQFNLGNVEASLALWSATDDVTLMGAGGGMEKGIREVKPRIAFVTKQRTAGSGVAENKVRIEYLQVVVKGDLAYTHLGDREFPVLVDLLLDSFLLQAAEEGLGDGIVPAIALPAHTRFEMVRTAESTPRVAAEPGSLIGVNQATAWPPATYGHQHRIENKLAMNGGLSGPADDEAREQIHDDGQIEPSLPRADVRGVGDPAALGFVAVNWRWRRFGIRTDGLPTAQRRVR
jgi:hypothetical protein